MEHVTEEELEKMRILIVEKSLPDLQRMAAALGKLGCQVEGATKLRGCINASLMLRFSYESRKDNTQAL